MSTTSTEFPEVMYTWVGAMPCIDRETLGVSPCIYTTIARYFGNDVLDKICTGLLARYQLLGSDSGPEGPDTSDGL
jgi:hypothetical protein